MNNKFLTACCGCFLLAWTTVLSAAPKETVYVSPAGDDRSADGSAARPFASIARALDKCRSVVSSSDTLQILVAPGDYYLDAPLCIRQDMGRPLVIRAQGTEKPRLMGGLRVRGWEPCEDGLYRAYVPEVKRYGLRFEQFYVDGRRAVPARTPNDKWYFVQSSQETPCVSGGRVSSYAVQRIDFKPEDWASLREMPDERLEGMTFRFYHKWDITRKSPSYIEQDSARIWLQGKGMKPWNPITQGSRYFMYGFRAALDVPGEWWLDAREGFLYYKPRAGERMEEAECMVPVLHQWLTVQGTPQAPVRNIRIEGLSFQYAAYQIPAAGEEPMQAAASTEAAMQLDFVENLTLEDCELLHTGAYALWIRQECHDNKVSRCYLSDLGSGGIKVGEPWLRASRRKVTSGNVIDNNIITDTGHEQPCGVGVALFHTSDNRVTHNEISHLLYSGISVGWVWGYNSVQPQDMAVLADDGRMVTVQMPQQSPAVRNQILYNHVHHIGAGELSDMGAVYTLGESEGTRVAYNVIHDVWSYDYGGWGLYTDEGSTGVEMSHNLVYRCKSGAFHQHYGKNNRIEHNILAFSHVHQVQLTRDEPHLSFHFRHNIILWERGKVLAGAWSKAQTDMDKNLYWQVGGQLPEVMDMPFDEWKKRHEPHSVFADPLFVDAPHDDFTFTSRKVVRRIGFEPFDHSQAGVYGDEAWKMKAARSQSYE